jgi:anaerobic dimethyl sulfoxide reductase subunit A
LDELIKSNIGVWAQPASDPAIAFVDFRRDPEKYPLSTPSGKIEIFSSQLFDLGNPNEIPAVPKYIQEWENPFEDHVNDIGAGIHHRPSNEEDTPGSLTFPLQAIGHHTLHRVHSTHDNNDWLGEAFPQRVFINPIDAIQRKIKDGDKVKVFNDRGALVLHCRITPRIMPGVVDIPQGAWWDPDDQGVDHGGNINVLTTYRWTPFAFGTAQHTIMVQIEKAERR